MAQAPDTGTEAAPAPARRRRRRGLELAGLAVGIIAGVSITLAWLIPARDHPSGPIAPSTHAPVLVSGSAGHRARRRRTELGNRTLLRWTGSGSPTPITPPAPTGPAATGSPPSG